MRVQPQIARHRHVHDSRDYRCVGFIPVQMKLADSAIDATLEFLLHEGHGFGIAVPACALHRPGLEIAGLAVGTQFGNKAFRVQLVELDGAVVRSAGQQRPADPGLIKDRNRFLRRILFRRTDAVVDMSVEQPQPVLSRPTQRTTTPGPRPMIFRPDRTCASPFVHASFVLPTHLQGLQACIVDQHAQQVRAREHRGQVFPGPAGRPERQEHITPATRVRSRRAGAVICAGPDQ